MAEPRAGGEMSEAAFRELIDRVSNWGRWGGEDQRGTLNYLTSDRTAAATRLVRNGETISLGLPLNTHRELDNPEPADHHMTLLTDVDIGSGPLRFAKDYIGIDYHNDGHSHIDALCHVAFDGALYNGKPSDSVTAAGAAVDTVEVMKDGVVGRGVLLDIPRLRGVEWLEPGEHVFPADLEGAERDQAVTVGEGDVLLVRTGHTCRLETVEVWDTASAKAGLHPECALFLAQRRVAALGCDGNSDTAPSATEPVGFPIHVLALNAMGMPLLDYLRLEDLTAACERAGRWEFLFVAAPLRIDGGTGSPLNPIAIF